MDTTRIERIHKRQLARFLDHLNDKDMLTPDLESDVKRVFGFIFMDVKDAIQEQDTEAKANEYSKKR